MPADISLLPEELRKREALLKHGAPAETWPEMELRFSIPQEEGEDIEIIEVDEGEIDQVLANEPWYSKFLYRASVFFEDVKTQLMQPRKVEPPPKLPPQFFTPPPLPKITDNRQQTTDTPAVKPPPTSPTRSVVQLSPEVAQRSATPDFLSQAVVAPVTQSSIVTSVVSAVNATRPAAMTQEVGAKSTPRIVPFEKVPRRVRVIKRVRKPVRVSFVSEDELRFMRIDVPKRRFTLITTATLFAVLIAGGTYLMQLQAQAAQAGLSKVNVQLTDIRRQIDDQQKTWAAFQDLEPRLKALVGLLDQHVSPTRLLDQLERVTLPSVAYESFSLTPDRRVALYVTADSFLSAARQMVAFKTSSFIQKIEASGYTAQYDPGSPVPNSVQFQVTLLLSEDALKLPPVSKAR